MSVDEDRDHAGGPVRLDETHAAHVAGEVVDVCDAADGIPAGLERTEIGDLVVDTFKQLMPLVEGLVVDRAEVREAVLLQIPHEPAADESAGAAHENRLGPRDALLHGHPPPDVLIPGSPP